MHDTVLAVSSSSLDGTEYWIGGYEGISVPFMELITTPTPTITVGLLDESEKGAICEMPM